MSGDGKQAAVLEIRSRPELAGGAVLSVIDGGAGIDPDTIDQLFNPFFTTKANGMGMGLSICRSIVEAHGGEILASNNPEGGATMTVVLPKQHESGHDV
jgi:signal transduction histidine kinase